MPPDEGGQQAKPVQQHPADFAVKPPTPVITVASLCMGIAALAFGFMLLGVSLGFGSARAIVVIFGLNLALGIAAVVCGHVGIKELSRAQSPQSGRGFARAGLITGYLAITIGLAHIAFLVYLFAAFSWD